MKTIPGLAKYFGLEVELPEEKPKAEDHKSLNEGDPAYADEE